MIGDVREFLTDSLEIYYPTVSGFTQATTWTLRETVTGHIWALSGSESIEYGGDNVRSTHRAVMPVATIGESDRVTTGGKNYLVRFIETKTLYGDSWMQVDLEYVGATA